MRSQTASIGSPKAKSAWSGGLAEVLRRPRRELSVAAGFVPLHQEGRELGYRADRLVQTVGIRCLIIGLAVIEDVLDLGRDLFVKRVAAGAGVEQRYPVTRIPAHRGQDQVFFSTRALTLDRHSPTVQTQRLQDLLLRIPLQNVEAHPGSRISFQGLSDLKLYVKGYAAGSADTSSQRP